jgi:hypothetical protein
MAEKLVMAKDSALPPYTSLGLPRDPPGRMPAAPTSPPASCPCDLRPVSCDEEKRREVGAGFG